MTLRTVDTPVPSVLDDTVTTATRYLSVGAYIDPVFRDRCLRDVYYQHRRFVAPSYGFDLVTVLWHCLRARRLELVRDGAIVVALAVTAYLDWRALVAIAAALIGLRTTRTAWGVVRESARRVRTGAGTGTTRSTRRFLLPLLGWVLTWLVVAVLVVLIISRVSVAVPGLSHTEGMTVALAAAITVFALPLLFTLWRQKCVEDFADPARLPVVGGTRRLRTIAAQQRSNTVIYSDFEPFIGSGEVFETWGFPVRLVRKRPDDLAGAALTEGEREFDEPPFTAEEIVHYVRTRLRQLTTGEAETRIPDLTIEDRVFLSAREIAHRAGITGEREMSEIIRNPTQPARHYLVCQVVAWGGDVVTTVYVHLAVQGRSLFLEVTTTAMTPCNERYRIVDLEDGTGWLAWLRALRNGLGQTPRTIVEAPGRLLTALIDATGIRNGRYRRRVLRTDRGALVSVRQLGTGDELRNFTQGQDIFKFQRLIENRVYADVLDFLDDHDVDTAEFRDRGSRVFHVGIVNNGKATVNGNVVGSSKPAPAPQGSGNG